MRPEPTMNHARWQELMSSFGYGANEATYRELVDCYSQKHRHYHNTEHVAACLQHLDTCRDLAQRPLEIEVALWFHDAVYNPLSSQNEQKSAEMAVAFLKANDGDEPVTSRVRSLILATLHDAPTETRDESLIVDIDLAILGVEPVDFARFGAAVRSEYRMIPSFIYRKKRQEILAGFLERPAIYQNEPFHSTLETQARENLARAIEELS